MTAIALRVELSSLPRDDNDENVTIGLGDLTGKTVRLTGLQARADLNGIVGQAGEYIAAKGRYHVKLPAGSASELHDSLAVKIANLEMVE